MPYSSRNRASGATRSYAAAAFHCRWSDHARSSHARKAGWSPPIIRSRAGPHPNPIPGTSFQGRGDFLRQLRGPEVRGLRLPGNLVNCGRRSSCRQCSARSDRPRPDESEAPLFPLRSGPSSALPAGNPVWGDVLSASFRPRRTAQRGKASRPQPRCCGLPRRTAQRGKGLPMERGMRPRAAALGRSLCSISAAWGRTWSSCRQRLR